MAKSTPGIFFLTLVTVAVCLARPLVILVFFPAHPLNQRPTIAINSDLPMVTIANIRTYRDR
jgi:hypothetical protein